MGRKTKCWARINIFQRGSRTVCERRMQNEAIEERKKMGSEWEKKKIREVIQKKRETYRRAVTEDIKKEYRKASDVAEQSIKAGGERSKGGAGVIHSEHK